MLEAILTVLLHGASVHRPGLPTDLHYAVGNFVAQAVNGEDIVIKVAEGLYAHSCTWAIWFSGS